jgi:serine/threonine protein kinase
MGAVYEVTQLSTNRPRALKILLPQLVADVHACERFVQEARVGASIPSEHVVETVAAGVEAGLPWLAMELLRGKDLAAHLADRGRLDAREVLEVFRQVCHAVGAAHRVGVVHRDLKPENIFLAESQREGVARVVKVLDFGIAKVIADGKTGAQATGAIGSPRWMAPEQINAGVIRPSTDVWALGLIAFELLTGTPWWESAYTGNAQGALYEILVSELEPASVRASRRGLQTTLPPGFDAWFARCVARDPAQRFRDAHEALVALTAVLSGAGVGLALDPTLPRVQSVLHPSSPLAVAPPPPPQLVPPPVPSPPWPLKRVVALIAGALVALVGVLVVGLWIYSEVMPTTRTSIELGPIAQGCVMPPADSNGLTTEGQTRLAEEMRLTTAVDQAGAAAERSGDMTGARVSRDQAAQMRRFTAAQLRTRAEEYDAWASANTACGQDTLREAQSRAANLRALAQRF